MLNVKEWKAKQFQKVFKSRKTKGHKYDNQNISIKKRLRGKHHLI